MAVQNTIAIIGATGSMGSAISTVLAGNKNELLLMARDHKKIKKLVDTLKKDHPSAGMLSMDCSKDACWEADIIVLAVPSEAETEVAEGIKEVVTQKIVISISPESTIEQLQQIIPHSKVVKAFYSNTSTELRSANAGREINTFIMGDEEALETVSELLTNAGLKPVVKHIESTSFSKF